jgi:aminoglycoside phosphotransferase (APT) family kinase protein
VTVPATPAADPSATPGEGSGTALSADILAWVEECVDGRVVHADRRPGGGRREAWVVDVETPDGVQGLFLRYDRSDPAVTGDPFTLHREARFYLALQDSPVPVPRVLGVHDTEQAILSERVPGETWFSRLRDEQQRVAVARDFMRILASLHRLDPSVLTIAGEPQPANLNEAVTTDLDRWEALYRFESESDDPMIEFGLDWLRRNRPDVDGPVVIVQGDTGPGNFLYADGRVTAVLDWELAHWGDPMDDLGWLALRAVQEPFTSLPDRLRDWEQHTGWQVDIGRVRYYRVLAELKVVILGHRRAEGQNLLGEVGNGLIYGQLHRRLFVEAMADVLGAELHLPDDIEAPATDVGWLYDAAMAQIREIIVPRSTDPFVVLRAKGLARILKHLQQVDRLGAIAAADEVADLIALTGADITSVDQGRARLAAAVRGGRVPTEDALRYFARRAARGTQLLRPAMGVLADRHFDPLS